MNPGVDDFVVGTPWRYQITLRGTTRTMTMEPSIRPSVVESLSISDHGRCITHGEPADASG